VNKTAYNGSMKLTVQLRLIPDTAMSVALRETVERFNDAANWLAGKAFALHMANKIELHHQYYRTIRASFGLSAQMAVRCIAQVCEAYKRDKAKRPRFRKHAAMPFDQRMMSFKGIDRVSLLTLTGRVIVPFVMGDHQRQRFTRAVGQCDIVLRRDGKWFLLCVVDLPDGTPIPATDFVGVDLGIVRLATDSDGNSYSGEQVERVRRRHYRNWQRLQSKGTKGAKKRLRLMAGREARFRRQENHVISKAVVRLAKDTGRGIALEDLKGIRDRTTVRKRERARHSGWSFFQLRSFVEYKAGLASVPVVLVDPRNTSRTCSQCGHCDKANRKSQDSFVCLHCGYSTNADVNAARNIRALGRHCKPAPELATLMG
jgi:putative transposase